MKKTLIALLAAATIAGCAKEAPRITQYQPKEDTYEAARNRYMPEMIEGLTDDARYAKARSNKITSAFSGTLTGTSTKDALEVQDSVTRDNYELTLHVTIPRFRNSPTSIVNAEMRVRFTDKKTGQTGEIPYVLDALAAGIAAFYTTDAFEMNEFSNDPEEREPCQQLEYPVRTAPPSGGPVYSVRCVTSVGPLQFPEEHLQDLAEQYLLLDTRK